MLNKTTTKAAVKSAVPKTSDGGNVALSMDKASATLDLNQTISLSLIREGKSLLHETAEYGIDDERAARLHDYMNRCNSAKAEMNTRRKPFTTALTLMQKKFVAEENAIDPAQVGSPAAEAKLCILAWQQARMDAAAEAERRLQKNREAYERRLARRDDLTDELRDAALQRAEMRLIGGQKSLRADAVRTERIPIVTSADGYLEVFKFWWEEAGKGLPAADLERHFHPMLSFARKQARKGILIAGSGIVYKDVPAL